MYDKLGNRIRQEKFDRDGKRVRQWLYDGNGKLVEDITYDGTGNIDYRFDVVYEGGEWKEKRMYSPPDRLHYRIVADRDAHGRLMRATYYGATGKTIRSDSYVYDVQGLLARVNMGQMGERYYEYDQHNNLKRKRINQPGASAYGAIYEFEHDGRGLLTRMSHLHSSITEFVFSLF